MANSYANPGRVEPFPDIHDHRFHDALDVVAYAEVGGIVSGERRCSSWHLDRDGRFACGTRATLCDSLAEWADDPERLVRAFIAARRDGGCASRWVIIDERGPVDGPCSLPGEEDAEQFLRLRRQLEVVGIRLLDAVIFDGANRWWSMSELLTGSTRWEARPFPLRLEGRVA